MTVNEMTVDEPYLSLRGVGKRYPSGGGVERIDLSVQAGEMLVLLGPSGCGKTTLLKIIAGLLAPDAGTVALGGADLTPVPTHKRNISMVFQTWALFPTMSVADNVGFGLRMKGMSKVDRRAPVEHALRQVNLAEYGDRRPRQLSGGQQQRVALARAIVTEPRLLLLDEPLSSLDHRIRLQLRAELRRLQRALGLTGVYVTHDHSEALALGDRIAVMRDGAVVEYGTPRQVFSRPRTRYAAEFLGVGNVIEVTRVTRTGDRVRCATALGEVEVAAPGTEEDVDAICLGHTDLRITSWPEAADREASPEGWAGTVVGLEYEKGGVAVAVELVDSGQSLTAFVPGSTELSISDKVSVQADWSAAFPLTRP